MKSSKRLPTTDSDSPHKGDGPFSRSAILPYVRRRFKTSVTIFNEKKAAQPKLNSFLHSRKSNSFASQQFLRLEKARPANPNPSSASAPGSGTAPPERPSSKEISLTKTQ
jgi:hypothetical protein